MKTKLGQGLIKGLKKMALLEKNKTKFGPEDFIQSISVFDEIYKHDCRYPLISYYPLRLAVAEKANAILKEILETIEKTKVADKE